MATKAMFEDAIRLRVPKGLKARLKKIALRKRTKYQFEVREAIIRFVEAEEGRENGQKKAA